MLFLNFVWKLTGCCKNCGKRRLSDCSDHVKNQALRVTVLMSAVGIKLDFNIDMIPSRSLNPLRPNSDLSQTSHCNIKSLSVSEVMRIKKIITQVKFY